MASELLVRDDGRLAGEDLHAKRGYGAKLGTSPAVVLASANDVDWIIVEGNTEGNPVTLRRHGFAEVIAGDTIDDEAYITTDGNGKMVMASANGAKVIGKAREAAVTDQLFSAEVFPPFTYWAD